MDADCHLLFVPVRETQSGTVALCTARLLSGQRVGLAFTSEALLLSAEGPGQHWIRLHEQAMHDMLAPLGVDQIRVDPCFEPARDNAGAGTPRRAQTTTPAPASARHAAAQRWTQPGDTASRRHAASASAA
jgi:hypothetical protein